MSRPKAYPKYNTGVSGRPLFGFIRDENPVNNILD
jgi:hypothetical protein